MERGDEGIKGVVFHFERPEEILPSTLEEIEGLIRRGEAVGSTLVKENLRKAFLIGYATGADGRVVGTVTLKHQRETYRRKLEAASGLDLSGYLERGYTSVAEAWRGRGIADRLIRGLVRRSPGRKVYVTIRMDNLPALELTRRHGMNLAARFFNQRTGHEVGLFIN